MMKLSNHLWLASLNINCTALGLPDKSRCSRIRFFLAGTGMGWGMGIGTTA